MTAVKDIISDGSKPLGAFDDDLFGAMIEKVITRSRLRRSFTLKNIVA